MRHFLLPLLLCVWVAPAFAAPKKAALPPSIRAMTPKRIVSLRVFRVAPAPKAPEFIIHLWTTPRRAFTKHAEKVDGVEEKLPVDSPFVMDIFTNEKTPRYQTTAIYASNEPPNRISLRYLNAKTKLGFVFEVMDKKVSNRYLTSFRRTLLTFPYDLHYSCSTQSFGSYEGQGQDESYDIRRDAAGTLEIEHTKAGHGMSTLREILAWNGEQFMAPQRKAAPK